MKTIKLNLFTYDELSKEAQEKALKDHNSGDNIDIYGLQADLDNRIEELLEEHKIKPIRDLKGYDTKYANIYFSLGHCQGDGVMFEGVFEWKKYQVIIKQSGHYYHSNSKTIEITYGDDVANEADEKVYAEFEAIYQEICKELEVYGYECIEHQESEGYFKEFCESMDYYFEADGTINNNHNETNCLTCGESNGKHSDDACEPFKNNNN